MDSARPARGRVPFQGLIVSPRADLITLDLSEKRGALVLTTPAVRAILLADEKRPEALGQVKETPMDLPTVEMEPKEAKQKFQEYRRALGDKNSYKEDRSTMLAYRALARGQKIIRLSQAFQRAGIVGVQGRNWYGRVFTLELPKIAIARADAQFAWSDGISRDGSVSIRGKESVNSQNEHDVVRLPKGTFEADGNRHRMFDRFSAVVPTIPPEHRPTFSLDLFHILWDAEWRQDNPPPPKDPALLKHLEGDIYAVLAVWDLTEVEQLALGGRKAT